MTTIADTELELTLITRATYYTFIRYFELNYKHEFSSKINFEDKLEFLLIAIDVAEKHKQHHERRHGAGAYHANFAKYGPYQVTPLHLIKAEKENLETLGVRNRVPSGHTFYKSQSSFYSYTDKHGHHAA